LGYILSKLFIILSIGIIILILFILKILTYFTTLEFLDYLKKHYPAKYYAVSMDNSYCIFAALFHAGNPIDFPLFILSSENLRDEEVVKYKRKIRFYYLIGLTLFIGIIVTFVIS
jgi:hypothetical protein